MPPVLDPSKSKVDGLAFVGLSLTRNSEEGHPDSITHQDSFDLNKVLDRDYDFVGATNDDGWLVGGGEPGPPKSYKLAAKDSSHVEIMRIGTYREDWGGLSQEKIIEAFESGAIMVPQIEVLPTAVIANPDTPPELEIRFDMEPPVPDFDNLDAPLPINWALRFIHNQLFRYFQFPSRFCPGPFHSTILRKAEFRSHLHRNAYFAQCEAAIQKWRISGPKPLNTGNWNVDGSKMQDPPEFSSGLWLFTDRDNITHFFKPNFLPPYDTPEKRMIILGFLREEWDEPTLSWVPAGSNLKKKKEEERLREEAENDNSERALTIEPKPSTDMMNSLSCW